MHLLCVDWLFYFKGENILKRIKLTQGQFALLNIIEETQKITKIKEVKYGNN